MSPVIAHAVVQRNKDSGRVLIDEDVQMPELQTRQVLVRVVNSALNPTDGEKLAGTFKEVVLTGIKHNLSTVMPLVMVLSLAATLQV